MIKLNQFPTMTDQVLHGLVADQRLKQKIIHAASQQELVESHDRFRRLIPIFCCLTAMLIIAFVRFSLPRQDTSHPAMTFTAATHTASSPVLLQNFLINDFSD